MYMFVYVVVFLAAVLYLLDSRWRPRPGPVLPYRLPVVGHLLLFCTREIHKRFTYWSQRMEELGSGRRLGGGGDVYVAQIFSQQIMVLSGYDAIYEAFVTRGMETGGRMKTFRLSYIFEEQSIALQDAGPGWKRLQTLVHRLLRQYGEGVGQVQDLVGQIADDLVTTIREKSTAHPQGFSPNEDIYLAITNILSSSLIGIKYEPHDPDFQKWIRLGEILKQDIVTLNSGWALDFFPWLRHFGNSTFTRMQEYIQISKELMEKIKQERGDRVGLVYSMFSAMEQETEEKILTEKVIRLVMLDLMLAGVLTSSGSLCAFLQILACHQEVQDSIHTEITQVLKSKNIQHMTVSERDDLPYTCACLLELHRYCSLTPLPPHLATVNTHIQGTPVAKGTIVMANLWGLHHNPKYWKNPWKFDPQRFLDERNQLLPSSHVHRKHMMAFGAGTRACPGQSLANARLFVLGTRLVQQFKVMTSHGCEDKTPIICDPRGYEYDAMLSPRAHRLIFVPRDV